MPDERPRTTYDQNPGHDSSREMAVAIRSLDTDVPDWLDDDGIPTTVLYDWWHATTGQASFSAYPSWAEWREWVTRTRRCGGP